MKTVVKTACVSACVCLMSLHEAKGLTTHLNVTNISFNLCICLFSYVASRVPLSVSLLILRIYLRTS